MSRFENEIEMIHGQFDAMIEGWEQCEDSKEEQDKLLSRTIPPVIDAVSSIHADIRPGDRGDLIVADLKLQYRVNRLRRLLDLGAPNVIVANQVRWVDIEARRLECEVNGSEFQYTEEEIEQLKLENMDGIVNDGTGDRIRGGLYGIAIGDAMGAPTEFMTPEEIRHNYGRIARFVGGGWLDVEPGETTDDTAMAICVAEGILESPDDPIEAIGRRFLAWRDIDPPDIGNTIRHTFNVYHGNWLEAAAQTRRDFDGMVAGNGSLMRCLPVALAYTERKKMEEVTVRQSDMTHDDDMAREACLICNRIAHDMLDGMELRESIVRETEKTRYHGVYMAQPECDPDGFVVHTFEWVLYLLWKGGTFADVVLAAANAGYDSDTVGAIAGGLKGLETAYSGLPMRWGEQIKDAVQLDALAEKLTVLRERGL